MFAWQIYAFSEILCFLCLASLSPLNTNDSAKPRKSVRSATICLPLFFFYFFFMGSAVEMT